MFGDKEGNATVLAALVTITLLATLVNSYGIYNLNNRIAANGQIVAGENLQAAAQDQPSQPSQQQAQPTEQQNQPIAVSVDDDPVMGDSNAPVTIVEFSDYQCPYCGRFFSETLPQLKTNYIDTGKVRIVYRDFPLSFHQYAEKAAEAAECAGDQNMYFEMHDVMFENQGALDVASLKKYAADLGMDSTAFDACLDSGKYASEVQKDFSDGQSYGVSGTPTFFINGVKVVGAQPYSVFQQVIDQLLSG